MKAIKMEMYQQAVKSKEMQLELWQSDQFIVSMKQSNVCGEKGLARIRTVARDTSSALRGGAKMSTKLATLTLRAKENPKEKFTSLVHLLNEDFLTECLGELKREKSPGIDGVMVKEYEVNKEANIKDLVARLKAGKYKPKPVKRVYIPKTDGKQRPLGIPTVEDKIVQMGIKKILEAIYEVDFIDVSFGFRPNRSPHDALNVLDKAVMTKPVNYVVDMDIEKYFDTIDHKWLMRCLRERIVDTNLLRLIGKFLNCGVMEEGKYIEVDKGTPQGGVISPVLANIYLHYILDLWYEKRVKKQVKGYSQLIRFADDFVVCFQNGYEARKFGEQLKGRLGKFGLRICERKSRIIEFGRKVWERARKENKKVETFDFLGFTHYCDKTRKGRFKLGRKTASSRLWGKLKTMNMWLKEIRSFVKLQDWWQVLRQKLIGHYNYYGISGNIVGIRKFYKRSISLAYKWTNRRSQKRSFNWEQFCRFVKYNPLPEPKIYHLTYTLSSY